MCLTCQVLSSGFCFLPATVDDTTNTCSVRNACVSDAIKYTQELNTKPSLKA